MFFSLMGDPVQNRPQTQPHASCLFSARKERVDLRFLKEGILGKKIAWGRVGWTGQKKEKRMRKTRLNMAVLLADLTLQCILGGIFESFLEN